MPGDLEALLEVQGHDTAIDQLGHRRRSLPESARLTDLDQEAASIDGSLADARTRRDAAREIQEKLEADVMATDSRIAEIDKQLYGGSIGDTRALLAMSEETASLKRRKGLLEDEELEAMVALEPLDAEVGGLESRLAVVDTERGELRRAIEAASVEIDRQVAAEGKARDSTAASVPADLMAKYEGLRKKLGGVGAARLSGSSCTGCHLTLPSSEVERLRHEPPDAVLYCDQCGRILVR